MNDWKTNQACAVPFGTSAEADAALDAFWKDVEAARVKHRIAHLVMATEIVLPDGPAYGADCLGSEPHWAPLAAFLLGQEQERHRNLLIKAGKAGRRKDEQP